MVGRDASIAVYILANRLRGTLYIGVTSQLSRRIWEHREGLHRGFTKTYGLKRLVWYEPHEEMTVAIQREKSLKRWPRQWKINLIERETRIGTICTTASPRRGLAVPIAVILGLVPRTPRAAVAEVGKSRRPLPLRPVSQRQPIEGS